MVFVEPRLKLKNNFIEKYDFLDKTLRISDKKPHMVLKSNFRFLPNLSYLEWNLSQKAHFSNSNPVLKSKKKDLSGSLRGSTYFFSLELFFNFFLFQGMLNLYNPVLPESLSYKFTEKIEVVMR